MTNEIKLKDMTDFLENVYKNIKEQPTLEEEKKQEKEFINKIKGNNTNEIKEILQLIGSCCYYGKISEVECEKYCNYITNLQKTQETLIKNDNEIITNLQQENERLKRLGGKDYTELNIAEMKATIYKSRIEKAVELLKEAGCYDEKAKIFCDDVWEELPELLDILRGDE